MINNDYNLAKKIESSGKLKESEYFKQGILLCKLYMSYSWSEDKIKAELYKRVDKLYPMLGQEAKYNDINKMYSSAKHLKPLEQKIVCFSNKEMHYIHAINDIQKERVLFGFLYLWKFYDGDFELTKSKLKEVAGINWNPQTLQKYITELIQYGYIKNRLFRSRLLYSINDELSDIYDVKDKCFEITNDENAIYYYLKYFGIGKYYFCKRCQCIVESKGHGAKYCKKCAEIVHKEQKAKSQKMKNKTN